jgi:CspA family cold shock protein
MFNFKNIIILCVSVFIAAIITLTLQKFAPLNPLAANLLTAFLAGISMLIMQNLKMTRSESSTAAQPAKSIEDSSRESGTVKWFDSNKGYGFITRSMGEDIFVHFRSIRGNGYRALHEGQSVEFLVTQGEKGPQAEDIQVIK